MSFSSLQFVVFFPAVTLLYYVLPSSSRWLLLLIASALFYMAFIPSYILILLFTIVIDYCAAIAIDAKNPCGSFGWAIESHLGRAENASMRRCSEFGGRECVVRAWACDEKG